MLKLLGFGNISDALALQHPDPPTDWPDPSTPLIGLIPLLL